MFTALLLSPAVCQNVGNGYGIKCKIGTSEKYLNDYLKEEYKYSKRELNELCQNKFKIAILTNLFEIIKTEKIS